MFGIWKKKKKKVMEKSLYTLRHLQGCCKSLCLQQPQGTAATLRGKSRFSLISWLPHLPHRAPGRTAITVITRKLLGPLGRQWVGSTRRFPSPWSFTLVATTSSPAPGRELQGSAATGAGSGFQHQWKRGRCFRWQRQSGLQWEREKKSILFATGLQNVRAR